MINKKMVYRVFLCRQFFHLINTSSSKTYLWCNCPEILSVTRSLLLYFSVVLQYTVQVSHTFQLTISTVFCLKSTSDFFHFRLSFPTISSLQKKTAMFGPLQTGVTGLAEVDVLFCEGGQYVQRSN